MHPDGIPNIALEIFEIRSLSENVLIDARSSQAPIIFFRDPEL